MENNNEKTKLQEAGAFWARQSKSGNSFLSGSFKTATGEEVKVMIFKNSYKTEGSNQPDYRAYFDTSSPQAESKTAQAPKTQNAAVATKATEEIPF